MAAVAFADGMVRHGATAQHHAGQHQQQRPNRRSASTGFVACSTPNLSSSSER